MAAVQDDPAVLTVKGRLLKDQASTLSGSERRRLYAEAGQAYARAAELSGAAYPLINAATLSLLAGEPEQARTWAGLLLERPDDPDETPYYRAATRAEALLLLNRRSESEAALAAAMARAPQAWEDHASTLRQFQRILEALGENAAWLDLYRPPRTLHFAGHTGIETQAQSVAEEVRTLIEQERVGFGFGALAAGADIVVAEALLDHGAELHLILPSSLLAFREVSVASFGADWSGRFDAAVRRADSLRSVASAGEDSADAQAIELAAEVAMGAAVMKAQTLATEAVQLLLLDREGALGEGTTPWIRSRWERSGRVQHLVVAPRDPGRAPPAAVRAGPGGAHLLSALLAIDPGVDRDDQAASRMVEEIAPLVLKAASVGPAPLFAPRWRGSSIWVGFTTPAAAADAALRLRAALGPSADSVRIAGHYGVFHKVDDPLGGEPLLLGGAVSTLTRMLETMPLGAIHVSEDFAAALHVEPPGGPCAEWAGEAPGGEAGPPTRLFSLRP